MFIKNGKGLCWFTRKTKAENSTIVKDENVKPVFNIFGYSFRVSLGTVFLGSRWGVGNTEGLLGR